MPATRGRTRTAERTLPAAPPRNDAWTALLVVSLVAMLIGTLFLFLDYSAYTKDKPPQLPTRQAAAPLPAGPAGGGVQENQPALQPPPGVAPPAPGNQPQPGGGAAPPQGQGGNPAQPPKGPGGNAPPE